MTRIAGSSGAVLVRDFRRRFVPVISAGVAILFGLFPLVVTSPLLPDVGFLVLLAWRLLRPEIWAPTAALAFGLFDDLVSGHPIGQSMALWTSIFLVLDLIETRVAYRDFWFDWLYALVAIAFYTAGTWATAAFLGSPVPILLLLPQYGLSVLAYPVVARMVYGLDRWRLR